MSKKTKPNRKAINKHATVRLTGGSIQIAAGHRPDRDSAGTRCRMSAMTATATATAATATTATSEALGEVGVVREPQAEPGNKEAVVGKGGHRQGTSGSSGNRERVGRA